MDRALPGKGCLPYAENELAAAREALARFGDASLAGLGALDVALRENDPELHLRLYPYAPAHLLTRRELDELFDTTPDLTGADLDISRFIRSGDERDASVFWRKVDDGQNRLSANLQPAREELCPVPFLEARDWLCQPKSEKRHDGCRAWVWDHLEDEWRLCGRSDIFPGRTLLVDVQWGGYEVSRGFTGEKPGRRANATIPLPPATEADAETRADAALERDDLSQFRYKTICTHSAEVAVESRKLLAALGLAEPFGDLFDLAARLHDWGKAHPVFQQAILDKTFHAERHDLAKAPRQAWQRGYSRPGFRHELASTLAVLELLRNAHPWHEALLGPHQKLFAAIGENVVVGQETSAANALADRLNALDAGSLNLLLYLICAHHGKVRGAWHATPLDQEAADARNGDIPLRGVRENDELPKLELPAGDGEPSVTAPAVTLHLDAAALGLSIRYGASWSERVLTLLETHGPFTLAYLEAIFRCADVRASRLDTPDPLLLSTP